MNKEWVNYAQIFQSISAVVAAVVGAFWVIWNYRLKRENHAKVQFDLELQLFNTSGRELIAEVVAVVENKGQVRHWLRDFTFDLLVHRINSDAVEGDERIGNQVLFEKVLSHRYWVPDEWKATFIDAGCTQRYRYVAHVPKDANLVMVYGKFQYPDEESQFHTAQKVFQIPSSYSLST